MPPAGLLPIVLLTIDVIGCAVKTTFVAAPNTVSVVVLLTFPSVVFVAVIVTVPAADGVKSTWQVPFLGIGQVVVGLNEPAALALQLMIAPSVLAPPP